MTFRDKLAISIPPLLLRLFLAATFIWAGYGKFFSTMTIEPGQAAVLANMGVNITPPTIDPDPGVTAPGHRAPDAPAEPLPEVDPPRDEVDRVLQDDEAAPRPPSPPDIDEPQPNEDEHEEDENTLAHGGVFMLAQNAENGADAAPAKIYTSADFTGPVVVRRLHGVTLALHHAGHPEADGARPLIPDWMLDGSRPVQLAWAAGLTELIGGVLVLLGLFTRLAALALAGVMAMALWLTSIGPVVMGPAGGASFLGILPALEGFSPQAWSVWLWQFALLMSALALALSRPGLLALDGLLFGAGRAHTKPAPAK